MTRDGTRTYPENGTADSRICRDYQDDPARRKTGLPRRVIRSRTRLQTALYWPGNKWGEMRAQLDEGARIAGRPPHSAMIAPYITSVILSENATEEERTSARFAAAAPLAYYIGKMGIYYAQMLTRNGYGTQVEAVKEGWKQGMKGGIEAVTPELLDATSIIGTPREIVAKLDQWVAAGVDEPVLAIPSGPPDEAAYKLAILMQALKE